MKKYVIYSCFISITFLTIYYVDSLTPWTLHHKFPTMVIFFFVQSVGISWLLVLGESDRRNLPLYALGSISLRFITGIFFLVFLVLLEVPDMQNLTIQFMVVYLSYLVFELIMVLANLRPNSEGKISQ